MTHATHQEPRQHRQRDDNIPQVDVTHSAAAEELAITVHLHVPDDYVAPAGIKASIAEAVQSIVFPALEESVQEEQES